MSKLLQVLKVLRGIEPDADLMIQEQLGNDWEAELEKEQKQLKLDVSYKDLYEYRDIWAEEGGATDSNSAEWSFGNGSVGYIGLPIDAGWEVESMGFHADTYSSNGSIRLDLMDYGNTPSNNVVNTIASIVLLNSLDGDGITNNGYKFEKFTNPIPIPVVGESTVIGFITRNEGGTISDARVYARLRRKIGSYVSDVKLV